MGFALLAPAALGLLLLIAGPLLAHLSLQQPNQRQAFGATLLLERLMQRALELKAGECFLEVRASNQSAYRLYERYGFNEVGRRRDYYPAVGGREDALVMACTLLDWA